MRDHGGDLDAAIARFGGRPEDWLDLSTGINRVPYPLPPLPPAALRDLPSGAETAACAAAARKAYGAADGVACLPLAGAQAAIRLVPGLAPPGRVGVARADLQRACRRLRGGRLVGDRGVRPGGARRLRRGGGRQSEQPGRPALAAGGASGARRTKRAGGDRRELRRRGPEPLGLPRLGRPGVVVLRSFGKFFGLAGLRLGFALGAPPEIARLREAAGPWPVSGPPLAAGRVALADAGWAAATRARLAAGAGRLDGTGGGGRLAARSAAPGSSGSTTPATPSRRRRGSRAARVWSRVFP